MTIARAAAGFHASGGAAVPRSRNHVRHSRSVQSSSSPRRAPRLGTPAILALLIFQTVAGMFITTQLARGLVEGERRARAELALRAWKLGQLAGDRDGA